MKARPQVKRRDRCPDFEALLDHWEGELAGEASAEIKVHLDSGCGRCAGVLREIRRVIGLLGRADRLREPPEEVRRGVLEAGRACLSEGSGKG